MRAAGPRILITGTPGVGKTSICEELGGSLGLKSLNVGDIIKQEELYSELDNERECTVYDDDAVYEYLNEIFVNSDDGLVIDFHSVEPMALKRWFDLILILHTDTDVLWNRLEKRNYKEAKIAENVECEIMRVVQEDVLDYFVDEPVPQVFNVSTTWPAPSENPVIVEADNNDPQQQAEIINAVVSWVKTSWQI